MRVLVAADHWYPDHRGGAARVAAATAALLAARGHAVDVLAPASPGRDAHTRDGLLAVHRVLPRSRVPETLADPRRTRRAAHGADADVVLAHTTTTAVGLARALPETPLAVVYHASAPREARFERAQLPPGRRRAAALLREPPLRLLERRALAAAGRILVLSEFSRGLLAADHPAALARTVLAPGGVDIDAFTPGDRERARARLRIDPGRRLLLTVRRLESRMGLEPLLDAFAALAPERPDLDLVVVGDGSLRARLEQASRAAAPAGRARLAGRVGDAELLDWYRAADLFVLPTVAYEGFGLVTAEALACGLPVVGTPVGATPELLVPLEPRLLATGATAAALAPAIARGLDLASPELRGRCRAYAERRLSWQVAFPAWEEALAGLLDLRPDRPASSRGVRPPEPVLRSGA